MPEAPGHEVPVGPKGRPGSAGITSVSTAGRPRAGCGSSPYRKETNSNRMEGFRKRLPGTVSNMVLYTHNIWKFEIQKVYITTLKKR